MSLLPVIHVQLLKRYTMNNNVIFLDCTQNYSYQFSAANTKTEFIAKGLSLQKDLCCIHNGARGYKGLYKDEYKTIASIGEVITYKQNAHKLISEYTNLWKLYKDIKSRNKNSYNNIIVLEFPGLILYFIYSLIALITNYKIVTISQEWVPTVSSVRYIKRPLNYLYSITFGYMTNGILPISEYIIKKIRHFKKPFLKVPILADFTTLPNFTIPKSKYFLYCVYAAYRRVITFIIDSYKIYYKTTNNAYQLHLVLSGSPHDINYIKQYIERIGLQNQIIIRNKLSYKELLDAYQRASALIIPLDPNNKQDEARFSQKIAEYLSSGTPIISNNVGEIKYYFHDKENIILAPYSTKGFSSAFIWIMNNPSQATQIGLNGYRMGKEQFNFVRFGEKIHDFLLTLHK